MKFYFDGDSFTYGGGLKKIGIVPEDVRWSRIVCDHFGAEEINLSTGGASNDRVMRHLFDDPSEVYDFYFLQLTISNRSEFYDTKKKKWVRYAYSPDYTHHKRWASRGLEEGRKFREWIDFGMRRIYNDHYGKTKENITYNALKSYVASVGRSKKSFFSTLLLPELTDNKYDLHFLGKRQLVYECIPNDGHPSVEGHKTIAKHVIDIVKERL